MSIVFNYNGTLAIESKWMWENGIMTEKDYYYYKKKISILQRGCRNTPAVVEYNSLPYNIKSKIEQKLKDTGEVSTGTNEQNKPQINFFDAYVRADVAAMDYFSKYEIEPGRSLPPEVQTEYYNNAIMLNAMREVMIDRIADRNSRGKTGRKDERLFSSVVNDLKSVGNKYPHTLPLTVRNLRPKFKEYFRNGKPDYHSLIHKNYANQHARVVTGDAERLYMSIYCMSNNPYAEWVHEDYHRFIAGEIDIVDYCTGELFNRDDFRDENGEYIMVSESTIWNYLNKPDNRAIVDSIRNNQYKFNHRYAPHYMRKAPKFSLSKVSFDDRDLPRKLKDGGSVFAYYAFDVMSGAVIGAAYSRIKDTNLFMECLRDMYRNLNRWGLGWPLEAEVEHHLCGQFTDTMLKPGELFPYVRFCAPTNSQEKHAESLIHLKKYGYEKRFQEGIGRHYAKLEANQTNGIREYNENSGQYEYRYKTYSWEQLIAEDRAASEAYNHNLHRNQKDYEGVTIIDALMSNVNPDVREIDKRRVFYYIGEKENTTINRNQWVNLRYSKYWLSSKDVLGRLLPNNYGVTAYYMKDETGKAYDEAYIFQKGKYIDCVRDMPKFVSSQAEWTEADTIAQTEQAKYISGFRNFVSAGKDNLDKVKIINTAHIVHIENIIEAKNYEVAPPPVTDDFEEMLEDSLCKYGGERNFEQAAAMTWY